MYPFLVMIKWTGDNWLVFLLILAVTYCLFVVIGAQLKSQENKLMWPIIFMGSGILIFGIGIIWFYLQQSNLVAITPQAPVSSQQPAFDSFYKELLKKTARLQLLKKDLSTIEKLQLDYENTAQAKYNEYLKIPVEINDTALTRLTGNFNNRIGRILQDISGIADDIKLDLSLNAINDPKQYDINMPFKEEDQIKNNQVRHLYRKAKHEYLFTKNRIDNLKSRLQDEISKDQLFIDNYAKGRIGPPQ